MSETRYILGTGTDIGKTFCLVNLIKKSLKQNKEVIAFKPLISGFNEDDETSDTALIIKALDLEYSTANLDLISPFRFKEAVSPHFAAKLEDREINFSQLLNWHKNITDTYKDRNIFFEAAGGVLSPITYKKTYLDLIKELNIKVILITNNYLGTISHTLTAIETIKNYNIEIDYILFNDFNGDAEIKQDNIETIKKFSGINLIEINSL